MNRPAVNPTEASTAGARRSNRRGPRGVDIAATVLFLAACSAPAVAALLRPGLAAASVIAENRRPGELPDFPRSLREAALAPRRLKAWFADHLGLRDVLLETRSDIYFHGLHLSPSPTAVIGDDGWLWYLGENSMNAWRGAAPLSPVHIESWVHMFRDRAAWCAAHGAAYVVAFTPNKMELYPERVPPLFEKIGPSRFEQMTEALKAENATWFVDLGAELLDERRNDGPNDTVYSEHGTHWNARGALRGARAFLENARNAGVAVEIPERDDFDLLPMLIDDDGWGKVLHLRDWPMETQPVLRGSPRRRWEAVAGSSLRAERVQTISGADPALRAWIVHDSFGALLRPILAPYFSRAVFTQLQPGDLQLPAIAEFAAKIVIDLHTERALFWPPPWLLRSSGEEQTAERFARSSDVRWRLADSLDRRRVDEGIDCALVDGELVITARRPGPSVTFSDVRLDVSGTPILHLSVDAQFASTLYLEWPNEDRSASGFTATEWYRKDCELTGGAQEMWIEILDPAARGPIRIRPDVAAGRVRVRSAEIRSAGW